MSERANPAERPKQSTRPGFECWFFSSFPELVSWNRSACGRGDAGCYAGRLAPTEFLQQRSSTRTAIWKFGSERQSLICAEKARENYDRQTLRGWRGRGRLPVVASSRSHKRRQKTPPKCTQVLHGWSGIEFLFAGAYREGMKLPEVHS